MKILVKILSLLTVLGLLSALTVALRDKQQLSDCVIRMHVVANSDSELDQHVKIKVKDAVMDYLSDEMAQIANFEDARTYLEFNNEKITEIAQRVIRFEGMDDPVSVSLKKEAFPVRRYDTFSLPSGVYTSLRISIGGGQGQNWWCVVFPTLCMPAGTGSETVQTVFSDSLSSTIQSQNEYEVRFLLLDWLGKLENFFFHS